MSPISDKKLPAIPELRRKKKRKLTNYLNYFGCDLIHLILTYSPTTLKEPGFLSSGASALSDK